MANPAFFGRTILLSLICLAPTACTTTARTPAEPASHSDSERISPSAILEIFNERPPGSCPRYFFRSRSMTGKTVPECPGKDGFYSLPRTYPPGTIFVGYAQHEIQIEFLEKLIRRARNFDPPVPINILVPRNDVETAYYTLEPYLQEPYSDFVNVILTPSDETLWTQDYFEPGINMANGRATLVDLPYFDREGEHIPSGLALSCHMNMVPQAQFDKDGDQPGNGDYGGNVEAFPGNLLLVGNNMTSTTRRILDDYFENELMTVHVSWLEIGHVDELFSVVPLKEGTGPCDFAVTYSSPALGMAILAKNEFVPEDNALFPRGPADVEADVTIEKTIFARCFSEISLSRHPKLSTKDAKICEGFIKANTEYDRLIREDLVRLSKKMTEKLGCSSFKKIPLPQLFAPAEVRSKYGRDEDAALAVNPNAVNSISLGNVLFVPEQPYKPFHDEIVRRLKPTGLSLELIDASYVHYLSGGIHCNSNVVRTCRPSDPSKIRRGRPW